MNPLSSVAKFKCQATHQDFRFSQTEFSAPRLKQRARHRSSNTWQNKSSHLAVTKVAPNSEATVDVLFRPVIVGSGEAKLSLSRSPFTPSER